MFWAILRQLESMSHEIFFGLVLLVNHHSWKQPCLQINICVLCNCFLLYGSINLVSNLIFWLVCFCSINRLVILLVAKCTGIFFQFSKWNNYVLWLLMYIINFDSQHLPWNYRSLLENKFFVYSIFILCDH
jgi:hypothetical protein